MQNFTNFGRTRTRHAMKAPQKTVSCGAYFGPAHLLAQWAFPILALAAFVFIWTAQSTQAQLAPADTLIRNVAEATYFNPAIGVRETIQSNEVIARVAPVPAIDASGAMELRLSRGALEQFQFQVRNTGNTDLEFTPAISLAGDVTSIEEATLYHDVNGNGVIDPQEPALSQGDTLSLEMSEQTNLIYAFAVSSGARADQNVTVTLAATVSPELSASVTSTVTITDTALELSKQQQVRFTGDRTSLIYQLQLRNNSEQAIPAYDAVDGADILIDGVPAAGVLITDVVPMNTMFEAVEAQGGMTALYHSRGAPARSYESTAPLFAALIDEVAFFAEGDFAVGRAADVAFSVQVDAGLSPVTIDNTAATYVVTGAETYTQRSNMVTYQTPVEGTGTISFVDPITRSVVRFGDTQSDARVLVNATSCNTTANIDTVLVTLLNAATGDRETAFARETGGDTGVFETALIPLAEMIETVAGDSVVSVNVADTVEASAFCGISRMRTSLQMGNARTVFNAMNNTPIEDITVVLLDAVSGAEVARTVSNQQGLYAFDRIAPGEYRFDIENAPQWRFPTVRPALPGYERTVTPAGRGAPFTHDGGRVYVSDLPLDPFYATPLALTKTAQRDVVSTGEFLRYSLDVSNNMYQALINAEVADTPDMGLSFIEGSARLDGQPIADPTVAPDGKLTFDLGNLMPISSQELTYLTRISAAASEGALENAAILSGNQAGAGTLRQSPPARAIVELSNGSGVFAREGTIIGTVFMDCDGNGLQGDASEPGIPGVRLVTQDGLFVVTDRNGKYSLRGLRPVTHALQIQRQTLPANVKVAVTRTNDLRVGGSRIVPLRRGELRAENFAAGMCTSATLDSVAKRRAQFDAEGNSGLSRPRALGFNQDGRRTVTARSEAGAATSTQIIGDTVQKDTSTEVASTNAARAQATLEQLVETLDPAIGFWDVPETGAVASRTHSFRVKGPADLSLKVLINGTPVAQDRVGEHALSRTRNVQITQFVATKLRAGANTLTLIGRDGFGIERQRTSITLVAPGEPANIDIVVPKIASADPNTPIPVAIRILDASGMVVPASAVVTLQARNARWDVTDIRPETPGLQTFIDNGEAIVNLIPPQASGPETIAAISGFGKAEAKVTFTPNLEDRILVGVIEGAVALGSGANGSLLQADRFSHFEDTTTGLNGALYYKGAIAGSALLTLRYDSDGDTEDRLFRDIDSDAYYPVYGDISETGFDAQSSSNLFVKIERGQSYMLYGDIAIEPKSTALKLGGERRVATGTEVFWENERLSVSAFAVQTDQTQKVAEIAGRGVSGPYDLALGGYVTGSERVEILVRDADGGDILSTTPLRRGTDYLLNYFTDTITFDIPLRQFDFDGNPVSARVTYEVKADQAERYWLYGGEAAYQLNDHTEVGVRVVNSDGTRGLDTRNRLRAAYVRQSRLNGGVWEVEIAHSEDGLGETDQAARLFYERKDGQNRLQFEAIHAGRNFDAGDGITRAGASQVRLSFDTELSARKTFGLSAEYTRDQVRDTDDMTFEALYGHRFNDGFLGEFGVAVSRDSRATGTTNETAITLGGVWTPMDQPGTRAEARLHLPVAGNGTQDTKLVFGVYRDLENGARTFEEAELIFEPNGMSTRVRVGGEYRFNDWLSGATELTKTASEVEETVIQNLDMGWDVGEAWTIRAGLEHSRKVESGDDALTSLALGLKWTGPEKRYVGDADFDTTWEDTGRTHYTSVGFATQATPDLAILARGRVALDNRNDTRVLRTRARVGAAYRPIADPRLDVLAWYEAQIEDRGERTETHLWSVDGSFEATDDLRLNGKYAGRHQRADIQGSPTAKATTQLAQAGLALDFWKDLFQLGVNGAYLFDDAGNSSQGLGLELGFTPSEGTLMALGYNHSSGQVSGQSELYQEGAYLRLTLLLGEGLASALDSFWNN